MNIEVALKEMNDIRIVCGDRWLVWGFGDEYVVYERKRYARESKVVIQTDDLDKALDKLVQR